MSDTASKPMPSSQSPTPERAETKELTEKDVLVPRLNVTGGPSEKALEYAKTVLGETEEVKTRCLQQLKDMILERNEVEPLRMDDPFLIRFLRARDYNVERAHRLLIRYMAFKDANPDYQYGVDPWAPCFMQIGEHDILTVLPKVDQSGRRIMLYKMGNWDPSKVDIEDIFRATMIIQELGMLEEDSQILGARVLFDLQGITISHAWHTTPTLAGKTLQLLETCMPMKVYSIHILNESWIFDIVYGFFKPFLGDREINKLYFHGSDLASLHEHIDPKFLPEKYGGTGPIYNYSVYTDWIKSLGSKNVYRRELKNVGYDIDEDETLEEY